MKFLQWLLAVVALLMSLGLLISGEWLGFIIALLAVIIVAPPIQDHLNQRFPWLKSRFLKIFLAVIILFIALGITGGNLVRFTNVAVCKSPVDGQCEKHEIAFLEETQIITVSAKLRKGKTANQVKATLVYWPEPDQESEVFSNRPYRK